MCLPSAIKAEADLGTQLLQTGTWEGNRGHKQWHVTVLSREPAALIEEVLKEALHLHRALKVQQALPCVVLLAPTCASFLHSPRHCTRVMQGYLTEDPELKPDSRVSCLWCSCLHSNSKSLCNHDSRPLVVFCMLTLNCCMCLQAAADVYSPGHGQQPMAVEWALTWFQQLACNLSG